MRDVNWLSRDIDDKSILTGGGGESAEITVFSKSVIRFVKVFNDSLKLIRNVDYPGVLVGVRRSSYALVANNESYDLIDLENVRKIPLFPIGEGEVEVPEVPVEAETEVGDIPHLVISEATPEPEPVVSDPVQSELVESEPVETAPVETAPVETAPVETAPVETAPLGSAPVETAPLESAPVESEPVESEPVESAPESEPVKSAPVESAPVESAPLESAPVESEPVESEPVESEPVESEPVESAPESAPVKSAPVESAPESAPVKSEPAEPEPTEQPSDPRKPDPPNLTDDKLTISPQSTTSSVFPPVALKQPPKPIILPVSNEEFLVTSGTINDKSMGLVVNIDGEISRGTIAWQKYPTSVAIDYPFVAAVIDNQVHLNSLHDQKLVQIVEFTSKPLIINVLSTYSTPYTPLVEKIALSPLFLASADETSPDIQHRIAEERDSVSKISICSSSLFIYTIESGIECLVPTPRFINLEKLILLQGKIDDVYDEMERMDFSSELSIIQLQYLNMLIGLYYLKQGNFTNVTASWLTYSIDPRIIIFIFDKSNVKGDIWIFNGLIELIKQLQEKYSTADTIAFLKNFYKEWFKKREMASLDSSNKENIFKSLELSYLQLLIKLEEENKLSKSDIYYTIDNEIISSKTESIELLEKSKKLIYLSHLYKKLNMTAELLKCWKAMLEEQSQSKDTTTFPDGEEMIANYLTNECEDEQLVWEYGAWLIQTYPKIGIKVFTSPNLKVKIDESQVVDVIKSINNDEAWRQYLKYLVYEKKRTLFAADLATVMIDDIIEKIRLDKDIKHKINQNYENYQSLPIPKMNYIRYLKRNLNTSSTSDNLLALRIELMELLESTDDFDPSSLMRITQDEPDSLLIEQCVVFGRLGIHEQCLDILCTRLTDYKTAIDYCIYGRIAISAIPPVGSELDVEIQKDLFRQLLFRFLKIPDPTARIACTRILLEQWGNRLDIALVLSHLPNSWPTEVISGYLSQFFKKTMAEQNQTSINRSLARSENLLISKQLQQLKAIINPRPDI